MPSPIRASPTPSVMTGIRRSERVPTASAPIRGAAAGSAAAEEDASGNSLSGTAPTPSSASTAGPSSVAVLIREGLPEGADGVVATGELGSGGRPGRSRPSPAGRPAREAEPFGAGRPAGPAVDPLGAGAGEAAEEDAPEPGPEPVAVGRGTTVAAVGGGVPVPRGGAVLAGRGCAGRGCAGRGCAGGVREGIAEPPPVPPEPSPPVSLSLSLSAAPAPPPSPAPVPFPVAVAAAPPGPAGVTWAPYAYGACGPATDTAHAVKQQARTGPRARDRAVRSAGVTG